MGENCNKRKLDLNWEEILAPERNDEPPAHLIVKTHRSSAPAPKSDSMSASGDDMVGGEYYEQQLSDKELELKISRMKSNYGKLGRNLPDKGEKLRSTIERLEKESQRRRSLHTEDIDGCQRPTKFVRSGASDGFRQGTASFQVQSQFASKFNEKLDKSTDFRVMNASDKESSMLVHCDRRKITSDGELLMREKSKDRTSSRERPFQCANTLSHKGNKSTFSKGNQNDRVSSSYSYQQIKENLSSSFPKTRKDASAVLPSTRSRCKKDQTVVLLDEDETENSLEEMINETSLEETAEQAEKLVDCSKDAKIYYPSRDDPECVEICYEDINNLAPTAYLTSPIMNFYIRFLKQQASPTNSAIQDCHFFNTYFYKKLKEAVSGQRSDDNSFFLKFRRWWRGINIFQKAYVLIPVHEDLHWSLVIICIPDKEDESGPIILHLDSLGLHSSRSVFANIKRYLKQEWNYLKGEMSPSDLPIADRIWKYLPRRIDEKIIAVPQQKNDYDCGLFVLYFMERFIKDAPERLKKRDLEMFGNKWFRPEEASDLRVKIRNLLKLEFKHASNKARSNSKSTSDLTILDAESGADIVQVT